LANFRIFETNHFLSDMKKDFSGQQERIKKKLTEHVYPQLRLQPYFGKNIKKLTNYQPDTWRYRIGDYRFFYEIDDKTNMVFMTAVDVRGSAY